LLQPEIGFSVSAGETLSVHGPNGAGKTSLLRAIAGLLDVPYGCISFRMCPGGILANAEERIAGIGWLGHQDGVKSQLSLLENLRFHCQYNRSPGKAEDALATLGLGHLRDLPAQYLSHGQRRRLAFARLLVVPRSLWLLDEPFSAIDSKGKECIRRQIQEHCKKGGIVVAATHEPLGLEGASLELE
jgi:heme exporter protein A